jgi:hypothetical protein
MVLRKKHDERALEILVEAHSRDDWAGEPYTLSLSWRRAPSSP